MFTPLIFRAALPRIFATLTLSGTYAAATVGVPYSSDLTISGGDNSYSNPRATVGTVPIWATLSIVSGKLRLSGTPTGSATTVSITVAVDSGDGQTASSPQSVAVSAAIVYAAWGTVPSGSGWTLSESGRLVSATSLVNAVIRSGSALPTKVYFEMDINSLGYGGTEDCGAGIQDSAASTSSVYVGQPANSLGLWVKAQNCYVNNAVIITGTGTTSGTVQRTGYAVNGRKVWVRPFGMSTWLGGGDPATGTSPTATLGGTGSLYAAATPNYSSTGVRLVSNPANMTGAVPSGFTAGF